MAESEQGQHLAPVSLARGDVLDVKTAAQIAGTSRDTILRWARSYGIGRQLSPGAPWRISAPALQMVIALDTAALEQFRAGNLDDDRVKRYLGEVTA